MLILVECLKHGLKEKSEIDLLVNFSVQIIGVMNSWLMIMETQWSVLIWTIGLLILANIFPHLKFVLLTLFI